MTDETLFAEALAISDVAARAAFLARACPDLAQRERVMELLAAAFGTNPLDRAPVDLGKTGAYTPESVGRESTASVGDRVGPYKLLEKIGEGGMGEVWVANQLEPIKRRVALKLIKPGMDSRSVLARFEAERQALAVMDHPNIAKVLDAGTIGPVPDADGRSVGVRGAGRPYFVMELVKGIPITEFADARKLTPKQRLELFVPVCQAIQHAHMKGIIHRDIKPSNVLVALHDETPVPKVIDFGVAKAVGQQLTEKTIYTGFGALVGTPAYMAPEQATFNQLDVDTRADVYALGVLLYELLAGSPPIEKERLKQAALDEVLRIVRDEEPPRPSARLSTSQAKASIAETRQSDPAKLSALMRGEIDWIVMKALEKDRTRRYETANGFAADVVRYLAGEPVQAVPPSLGYRLKKAYRRNRAAVWVSAAFALLLTAGVAVSGWLAVQANAARDDARHSEAIAREHAKEEHAANVRAQEERIAADAARVQAERAEAEARAMADFLRKDLLSQASLVNQAGGGNPHVTVRQVLQNAINRLEGQFGAQPLVEASLRQTIAETCMGLNWLVDAKQQLETACELRAAHQGGNHPDTIAAKTLLADLLQGRAEAHPSGSMDFFSTDTNGRGGLVTAERNQAWSRRAAELRQEIHAFHVARSGPDHLDTKLARFELDASSDAPLTAERVQQFLALYAAIPQDHPKREQYGQLFAVALVRAKSELPVAEAILADLVARGRAGRSAAHPATVALKLKLVAALREQPVQEKWDRALATLNEIRPALRNFDRTHPLVIEAAAMRLILTTGSHLNKIAGFAPETLIGLHKIIELMQTSQENQWRKLEAIYGPEHPETVHTRKMLADDLATGLHGIGQRLPEAAKHWRALYAIAYRTHGPDHATTKELKAKLDDFGRQSERAINAPPRAGFDEILRNSPVKSREFLNSVVGLVLLQGAYDPTLTAAATEALGPADPMTIACLRFATDFLVRRQRVGEAEKGLRDHLAALEQANAETWATGATRALLGEVLLLRAQSYDARKLLVKAWEKFPAADAENHNRLCEARATILDHLIRAEDAAGRPAEAAKWRKEYDNLPTEKAVLPKSPPKFIVPRPPAKPKNPKSVPPKQPPGPNPPAAPRPVAPPPREVKS